MKPLLRFGRRRSSWELDDISTIAQIEFRRGDGGPDLAPSAYEIDAQDTKDLRQRTVRVYTEHAASFLRSPPKGIRPLDLAGLREDIVTTPGCAAFRYANDCHREVRLVSEQDLIQLVAQVRREFSLRVHDGVTVAEMLDHAAARLADEDAEWLAATAPSANGCAWLRLIDKRQRRDKNEGAR